MKLHSPIPHKKARLEIIPLIDIMFFLLASFMLVSLSMSKQQTIKVNLPTAVAAQSDVKPDMINLAVDAQGAYFMDKENLILPDLEKALAEKHAANPEMPVYISGDMEARHGAMVQLLDTVRRTGFQKVAFQVRPPADGAAPMSVPVSTGPAPAPGAAVPPGPPSHRGDRDHDRGPRHGGDDGHRGGGHGGGPPRDGPQPEPPASAPAPQPTATPQAPATNP